MSKIPKKDAVVNGRTSSDSGYIKLHRSADAEQLMRYPGAFILLAKIALQANWRPERNEAGLGQGQCYVGDWASLGLTEGEYRGAKKRLTELGFARFQGRGPKGTVATLLSQTIFDLNIGWVPPQKAERKLNGKRTDSLAEGLTDSRHPLIHSSVGTCDAAVARPNGLGNGLNNRCLTEYERLIKKSNELIEAPASEPSRCAAKAHGLNAPLGGATREPSPCPEAEVQSGAACKKSVESASEARKAKFAERIRVAQLTPEERMVERFAKLRKLDLDRALQAVRLPKAVETAPEG